MSEILLPSIDNKFVINKNKAPNKIKKKFNSGANSFRNYLLGNSNPNTFRQHSIKKPKLKKLVNLKKHIKTKLKGNFTNKDKFKNRIHIKVFLKNKTFLDLESNKHINKKLNLFLINKSNNKLNSENNSIKNKNYNTFSLNYLDECDPTENNNKYITTDLYNNFCINKYNNESTKLNRSIFNYKNKKLNHSMEVNKIINSLINSKDEKNKNINDKTKIRFPKEKTIDPFRYINFNLKINPNDKNLFKGVKTIINQMNIGTLREEYENDLLQKVSDANNLIVDSNNIKAPLGEAKIYKKKYEDMIKQTKQFKSFNFNKQKYPQKNNKFKYNPQLNNLDKTYKNYFDKKFNLNQDNNNNKQEKNENKKEKEFIKNIDKYLSFDARINNILFISKNTEDNINQKSKVHDEMLNKFNLVFKSYLK